MYKLKNSYIDKMIANKLSSKEIDFVLHIALYQDESGCVESVYYLDVCKAIKISYQKFYDILYSLYDKGMIIYEKKNYSDFAVTLQGNSFDDVDYTSKNVPGYVNVAQNEFNDEQFMSLKAGSKLLYLYSQRFINGKHMLVENFYNEFCRLFNVVRKTMQYYVHELKEAKLLFINIKRNMAYHYEMMMKRSTVLYRKQMDIPSENHTYENNIASLIRRNFKRYLPDPAAGDPLNQIASLVTQKRSKQHKNIVDLLINAIKSSIKQQKDEGQKNPILNAALVNKWFSAAQEQQILLKYGIG